MSSPDEWGRPPSRRTLLLLLHGLAAQLQGELSSVALSGAVEAAQRFVLDWAEEAEAQAASEGEASAGGGSAAAASKAAKWPLLDSELAEAALELLLVCHSAAEEQEEADGWASDLVDAAAAVADVQQAAQGIMRALCARQEALPPSLGDLLLDAFCLCPALEDWAVSTFGQGLVDDIYTLAGAAPPLLLTLRPEGNLALGRWQGWGLCVLRGTPLQKGCWSVCHETLNGHASPLSFFSPGRSAGCKRFFRGWAA